MAYDMQPTSPSSAACAQLEQRERPAWCAAKWCYVDTSACSRPHFASAYFTNVTSTLHYSYETCGCAHATCH